MKNKRVAISLSVIALILCIPLIAMEFTDSVSWGINDFAVAGVLLLSTGLILELIFRKVKTITLRITTSIGALIILLLIWIELAVGIF